MSVYRIAPLFVFACAWLCASADTAPARVYAYPDLVRKIYDMEALAQPPLPGERSAAATSYDRASRYDEATGRYVDWAVNSDGRGIVRTEGSGEVLADIEGPGVLWRLWSAQPEMGHIQIFIDGNPEPVVDTPFRELFNNGKGPFAYSTLNREMARGFNLFVPIAFQKSCKIVGQRGWGVYFHCTYTQFPQGTQVPSFTGDFSAEDRAALAKAQDIIARRETLEAEGELLRKQLVIPAHSTVEVFNLKGPNAIARLGIQSPLLSAKDNARALRELALSIQWDDEASPAVWAPLGDFFGSGYGLNPYAAIPSGASKEGLFSRWYMPFGKQAVLRIHNDGSQPQTLDIEALVQPLKQDADSLLRFHAKWHRNHFGDKQPERYFDDRWPDWPLLLADGTPGRFCGTVMHVWNPAPNRGGEPRQYLPQLPRTRGPIDPRVESALMTRWWWGEGDEKFFVDGERFPSTFGTGTEDYIGYAWCDASVFDSHTQAQPRNHRNTGHIVVARWQIADNIPFQASFEGVIEKYHDDNWPLLYAATSFWYQAPGTTDAYPPLPLRERVDYFAEPQINPLWLESDGKDHRFAKEQMRMTLVEAETALARDVSEGLALSEQAMTNWDGGRRWSGGKQRFGRVRETGQSFVLEIPAEDGADKTLYLFATRAPDYGVFSVEVNGEKALEAFDGYAPQVEAAGSVKLGTFTPKNGVFLLKFTATGSNPKTRGSRNYIGIDAVGLRTPQP